MTRRFSMKNAWFRLILLAAVMVLAIAACDLFGDKVSISERISRFESDINNNLSAVYQNLHPSVQQYNASKISTFWNTYFPSGDGPYAVSVTGGNTRTGLVTGRSGSAFESRSLTLSFREDGRNNWKIDGMVIQGTTVINR